MWMETRPRRIFAYTAPTDMRKSFHGLLALVRQVFRDEDPYAGSLFVFVNRRGSFVKALAWNRTGFVLYAKRLERGRFVFPSGAESQELSERAFRFLLRVGRKSGRIGAEKTRYGKALRGAGSEPVACHLS